MSDFINTRDLLGDQECADAICQHTLTEFHDKDITVVGYRKFYDFPSLTSVQLPSLTRINENGFFRCDNVEYMDLGNVSLIGSRALDCPKLTTLYLRNPDKVCTYTGTEVSYFPGRKVKDQFTIFVPANLVSAYASSIWGTFASTITAIPEARNR